MSEFLQLLLKNDPIVRNVNIDQENEKETKFCLSFCQPLKFNHVLCCVVFTVGILMYWCS